MILMPRYGTYTTKDDMDKVIERIKDNHGSVTSVSYDGDGYLILYKADDRIPEDVLKDF